MLRRFTSASISRRASSSYQTTEARLYTARVFAGLAAVILIGLLIETLGFKTLERLTLRRWGVQR